MEMYGMTGERLGTIGSHGTKNDNLPQWKKDFLSKPSISARKGIAWGYSPPYEDTSTLVLTSCKSGFVDVRFPVQHNSSEPLKSNPSFWAFTGTSTTTFPSSDPDVIMAYSSHAVFHHEIDSRGPGISDEGDMFMIPNGDCIEVGMMENPNTKRVEMYKEYWTKPRSEPGSGPLEKSPCVVAKTVRQGGEASKHKGDGVIIRIGDHRQGILETGDDFLVERWLRGPVEQNPALSAADARGTSDAANWLKDWRSNTENDGQVEVSVPCTWVCGNGRKEGDLIVAKGITWEIVEVTV